MNHKLNNSFNSLKKYCEKEKYIGWDPFDGLNSNIFKISGLHKGKIPRLAWIQLFKRNPFNLRPLLFVSKGYNPKGLGLFLTSYCNLYKIDNKKEHLDKIIFLSEKLIELQSHGFSGACWGYNFDWQSRAFFLPKGTPTVVVTSFVACALMDAYGITKNQKYLDIAISSGNFITKDLNRTKKNKGFIFSYSPFDKTCVYNASLLGSKLLSRIYSYTKDKNTIKLAKNSVLACAKMQRDDGSWLYGELKIQNWIDSYHTGFNLESMCEYQKHSGDDSFKVIIEKGLKFYLNNFFLEDGRPKYYDKKIYPIDIHSPAQLVVTLSILNKFKENQALIGKVLNWTIDNMQDSKQGYFYYQLKKRVSSKIPYMRWSQAWMFYAFSFYLLMEKE